MRPSLLLFSFLVSLLLVDGCLFLLTVKETARHTTQLTSRQNLVASLGLTDLALTTEARYTRHPAVSDPMAPFMDHPGAIEHFPSGSFSRPPTSQPASR